MNKQSQLILLLRLKNMIQPILQLSVPDWRWHWWLQEDFFFLGEDNVHTSEQLHWKASVLIGNRWHSQKTVRHSFRNLENEKRLWNRGFGFTHIWVDRSTLSFLSFNWEIFSFPAYNILKVYFFCYGIWIFPNCGWSSEWLFMIFYALMSILCLFYDISTFQSFFMNFYDFMPSGSPARILKYSKHIGLNSPLSDVHVAEFIKSLFMSWSLSETRSIFFETLESRIPENTPE